MRLIPKPDHRKSKQPSNDLVTKSSTFAFVSCFQKNETKSEGVKSALMKSVSPRVAAATPEWRKGLALNSRFRQKWKPWRGAARLVRKALEESWNLSRVFNSFLSGANGAKLARCHLMMMMMMIKPCCEALGQLGLDEPASG